jgi:hypothetical protein
VKYNLRIHKSKQKGSQNLEKNHVNLTKKYSGVILNSSLGCSQVNQETTYYYDTRSIVKIGCNDAVNASLNWYMKLRYRLSDLNSTQNFLQGIRDWKIMDYFPDYLLILHGQLSIVKLESYSTIHNFLEV